MASFTQYNAYEIGSGSHVYQWFVFITEFYSIGWITIA
jgi:hypothetical protein